MRSRVAGYAETDRLETTAVTCFELLSGAKPGKAAEVRRELDRTGQPIGMGDSLIAGTALVHGMPLFTGNTRHLESVAGLKLVAVTR